VLVAENYDNPDDPIAFTPVECVFNNGETFKHFDLKWKEYENIKWIPCADEDLAFKLKDMSKKMFVALSGSGYGRTDIRVDAKGDPYYLEINANPGIFYPAPVDHPDAMGSADFILVYDKMGHVNFIEHIMKCAIKRAASRVKKTEVRFKPGRGYGLYAKVNFEVGDTVQVEEEKAQYLVTKEHVNENWKDPLKKRWFEQYAYPITEKLWKMWAENPAEWKPINHSCDPNTLLQGLNVIARRTIAKGEQITMDYATFCCDNMETFECSCKSTNCRKVITGVDYIKPFVEEYGSHVSDYVRTKRTLLKEVKMHRSSDASISD